MKRAKAIAVGAGVVVAAGIGMGIAGNPLVGPTGEPQAVDASMFIGGGMEAPGIDIQTIVNGPRDEVYKRFTTSEGWKQFLMADSAIDLRIGGLWEIYFNSETKIGSNGCQVLSYVPNEMVSFSWNAPPKFADERAKRTWVAVTFTDEGSGKTQVRLRHLGFTADANWQEVRKYFAAAWPSVLKKLSESFDKK